MTDPERHERLLGGTIGARWYEVQQDGRTWYEVERDGIRLTERFTNVADAKAAAHA